MEMYLNNFSSHYKRKYGKPVGKITLGRNVPCPNRRKGGCTFCASKSFTPYYLKEADSLQVQINKGKKFLKRRDFKHYFAYFQQETTTAGSTDDLIDDFQLALIDPDCIGLIISTRPDYIKEELLDELNNLISQDGDKEIILELGLQSAHDKTLLKINRNHSFADFVHAAEMVRERKMLQLGAHVILGLPGEGAPEMIYTVQKLADLHVKHVKFHHLQVIKDTPLETQYNEGQIEVFEVEDYMSLLAELLGWLPKDIIIHRLWSISDKAILVAPHWGLSNHRLSTLLRSVLKKAKCCQGDKISSIKGV